MRSVGGAGSVLRSKNRLYFGLLLLALLCLVYVLLVPTTSNSSESSPSRFTALLQSKVDTTPPVCNCNCNCGDERTTAVGGSASSKMLALRSSIPTIPSSSVTDAEVAAAWAPQTHTQSYQPSPRVVAGDGDKTTYHQFARAVYPPVGPEKGSIWDGSWFDTPVAYGTHHVPAREDDGFPTGFVPRPACQKDIDALQNYIYSNQHPADCKTKKLFVRRHMPGYGLFAGLGLSSNYIFLAAVLGRTLIDLSPNTYFTGNCASNNLECAFLPVSSCTADDFTESEVCYDESCWDTARVISIDRSRLNDFLPCAPTEYPKERCQGPPISSSLHELVPGLTAAHGEHFFQTEFSRYLTRPNAALAEFTAARMQELGVTDQLIAVHVRHGDKQEGIQFPTRAYSLVVRRVVQITGIKTVFIGSDDKSVYEELPKWVDLPNIRYVWLDDPNPIVFSANQAKSKGHNTIGMYLMTQTAIASQAAAYIGTRSSNAGQLVYALQQNDCTRQKIAYDMYGDLFYNSWYCRGDIQHAGREWMCALQKPEKDEGLIWKWGGARTEC